MKIYLKQHPGIIRFLSRLLNISGNEWARVGISWALRFFFQVAAVIGTTVTTAMFVEEMGITNLPYLYIVSALFTIVGSALFIGLLERFSKHAFIVWIAAAGATMLFFVESLQLANPYLFFGGLLLVSSMLVGQLNVLLSLFIEELFTPLESERTFPVIESAEPLGGITAGLLILTGISYFPTEKLLLFWAAALIALGFVLAFYSREDHTIPRLQSEEEIAELGGGEHWEKVFRSIRQMRAIPFIRVMFLVVFLQFAFTNLLEYQYTSAVDANVTHEASPASHENTAPEHGVASGSHADALTHGLSLLHILFSSLLLIMQLFIASRVNRRLGVISTMKVHPIITMMTSAALFFKFGLPFAVTAKAFFEMTGGLQRNAYHASFYALRRHIREHAKEVMEGVIRPIGMIAGTSVLLAISILIPAQWQHSAISAVMFGGMLFMLFFLWKIGEKYTQLSRKNLEMPGNAPEKFEAIEILSQRGHKNPAELLVKNLMYRRESSEVKTKILKTLGKLQNAHTIPEILKCFTDEDEQVQHAAVRAMVHFDTLGKHFFTQSFAKHRVTEALQQLFLSTHSKRIKSDVINVFANINQSDIVPFLIEVLQSDTEDDLKADAIAVCGMFHDISAAHYLEPFLQSKSPQVRANTIIALWQFVPYRLKLLVQLTQMLESKDEEELIAGFFVLGETKAIQEIPRLKRYLEHESPHVRLHAAAALGKMNHSDALEHLFQFALHEDEAIAKKALTLLEKVHPEMKKSVQSMLRHEAAIRIRAILHGKKGTVLERLGETTLRKLRDAYVLAGEEKEVLRIDAVLRKMENAGE